MQKFFRFLDAHKSLLTAVVMILILLATGLLFYKSDMAAAAEEPLVTYAGRVTAANTSIRMTRGDIVVQEYNVENLVYRSVGLQIDASGMGEDGLLSVSLRLAGSEALVELSPASIPDNGMTVITLPQPVDASADAHLFMTLRYQGEGTAAVGANSKGVAIGACTENGDAAPGLFVVLSSDGKSFVQPLFLALLGVSVIILIALLVLLKASRLKLETLGLITVVALGLVYLCVFPPNTVADETTHYASAYHYSNLMTFHYEKDADHLLMRQEDKLFFDAASTRLSAAHYQSDLREASYGAENAAMVETDYGYLTNRPLAYLPAAVGITLGRVCNLGGYWVYQLARLFNLLFYAGMVFLALRLLPFGKIALLLIAILPMSMQLAGSTSYDVYSMGMVFVLFSYILHIWHAEKPIMWKQFLLLSLLIVLAVPYKIIYIGVAAIVLLLPKSRFARPKAHLWFKLGLLLVALGSLAVLQLERVSQLNDSLMASGSAGYTLSGLLTSPRELLRLYFGTFKLKSDFYLCTMIGSGFGWLQTDSPLFLITGFILLLLLAFQRQKGEPAGLRTADRFYLVFLLLCIYIITLLLLLLDCTPIGAPFIVGVQGRYFIPALPLLFLLLRNDRLSFSSSPDKVLLFSGVWLNLYMLLFQFVSIAG